MCCSHALLNVDGMTCLKVENLAHHTSSYTLKHVFEDYGPLGDVYIPRNHLTEEHYGFAFIHFYNKCDANDALHSLNGFLLDGCKLKVQMVYNDDPHYAQPDCSSGRQYQYKEENHDLQSECERQHFSNTRIQTRSHSRSSGDDSEFKSQSSNHLHRRSSSTRFKTQSSVSTQQLPNRACPKSKNLPGKKKKPKPKSSYKSASKYPSGGGLLVGEKLENNQRQVENGQSNSMFEKPCRTKVNATHTLITRPSTRSQTRKRLRSPQNSSENSKLERKYAENKERQMEYPQSPSIIKRNICGANTADVLHSVDSESGQLNSLQQSEKRTKMGIEECGFWTANCQGNSSNDITGRMRFTCNKGNTIPQNGLSGLSCHHSNRKIHKQLDYQELESMHVTPFTQEGNITEVLMEDTCSKETSTRQKTPDILTLKETIESRLHPDTKDVALGGPHYCLSLETFEDLRKDKAYIFSNSHTFLPLRDNLAISELQKLYFFPSFPTIEHILTESTAHRSQSTSVTPTKFTTVEIDQKEHTKTSSCSNQTDIQISDVISDDETLNTNLECTIPSAPCETSGNIMLGVFEVDDNFTEFDLQSCDSLSSQNNRRVHSGHSRISRSVSSLNSNSTTSSSTNHSLLSLLNYSQQFLPVSSTSDNIIGNDINLPHTSQINQESNEFIVFNCPPFEARQQMHVTSPETSNDSDYWPVLPDFSNFNDIHNNHPKGLTEEQINNLPVIYFCENDEISHCSICLTQYIKNSKIRVLPCFHEYHDKCIDRWLSDNSTCPICRKHIINSDDTEFLF
ncbi:RIKEN cDNA 4930595M18 [Mus musculus]|nr:RIKEN cDNA 4930595M18 [Mus musculus]